jgi:AcrR family transcriptional regulator
LRNVTDEVTNAVAVAAGGQASGGQAQRRRGRPGNDLEDVLRAAVEVFNERGYDGASMEDLSKRLGIAKSGIYHHVAGKEELLRLALDRALDGLWEAGAQASALDAPAVVRLEALVRGAASRGSMSVLMSPSRSASATRPATRASNDRRRARAARSTSVLPRTRSSSVT